MKPWAYEYGVIKETVHGGCVNHSGHVNHSGFFVVVVAFQSCPGLEQYVVKKFAESLESLPRALAENAGVKVRGMSLYV